MKEYLKKLIIKGVIGFVIGAVLVKSQGSTELWEPLLMGFIFAGVPYGWQLSGKALGGLMVIGSLPVMAVALILRLVMAIIVGWIAYPIALIGTVIKLRNKSNQS